MNRTFRFRAATCGALVLCGTAAAASPLFTVDGTYGAGDGPSTIVTGDFDENGHTDFAVTDNTGGAITIRFGLGNGAFGALGTVLAGDSPTGLVTGYIGAGNHLDLVVTNFGDNTVTVLLQTPEPSSFVLAGIAGAALLPVARRRKS